MRARLLALAALLCGCSALLGVPDLDYDPNAPAGQPDGGGSSSSSSSSGGEGGTTDDGGTCVGDLQTDAKNCGRCGHDCAGGPCNAGTCGAFELASVAGGPLQQVALSDTHVFVSPRINFTYDTGGIWRIPKGGGTAELWASPRYAKFMTVQSGTLYFAVEDDVMAPGTGGIYACPTAGAAPCQPQKLADTDNPRAVTFDQGKLYFPDVRSGIMELPLTVGATPTLYRADKVYTNNLMVEGSKVFYSYAYQPASPPYTARLLELFADGGTQDLHTYQSPSAEDGIVHRIQGAFLFTAYDFTNTTGGVVRRVPRDGSVPPCDFGGATNKRPFGVTADTTRVYWTNQGDGAKEPYTNGSVVSCPLAGCCATPDVELWKSPTGQPMGLTSDATALYWVNYANGAVWKVAKP
jgi:hypothetical protein